MVNAPAGGQAGAARCCHRAKCFGLAVGLCRGLKWVLSVAPLPWPALFNNLLKESPFWD